MYKKYHNDPLTNEPAKFILRTTDFAHISMGLENNEYQKFKKHMEEGKELQDADGTPLTAEQIQEFLATLP